MTDKKKMRRGKKNDVSKIIVKEKKIEKGTIQPLFWGRGEVNENEIITDYKSGKKQKLDEVICF